MKILYLDCPTGASGNMILAALIEAGYKKELLLQDLKKLSINLHVECEKITKNGIAASFLQVESDTSHSHHRNLATIKEIISKSALSNWVKEKSISIFNSLATAEAKVHNADINNIHFHEVGAADAIVDIVGTVCALSYLQIDKITVSPLAMGSGYINCQHGILPVPAPATLELAKGFHIKKTDLIGELLTPTGAAIIATLANNFGSIPNMIIDKVGFGAGSYELPIPNILRAIVGTTEESPEDQDICVIECNIDDMNPEFYPYITEKVLKAGAIDVCIVPALMKKGRPGNILQTLVKKDDLKTISKIILTESTTLGVRYRFEKRYVLDREFKAVDLSIGSVNIKISSLDSEIITVTPEFEDCKKVALNNNLPIKTIYELALEKANLKNTSL